MKTTRSISIVLAVIVAAAPIWTIHQYQARIRAEASVAKALRESDSLRNELENLERFAKQAEPARAMLHDENLGEGAALQNATASSVDDYDASSVMRRRVAYRAGTALYFHSLFSALRLSPAQMERFEDLICEKSDALNDIVATAKTHGIPPTDSSLDALRRDAVRQFDVQMKILLGAGGFKDFQGYGKTVNPALVVADVAGYSASTGNALSQAQGRELERILITTATVKPGSLVRLDSINWDAAMAQAQELLSTEQMAALRSKVAMTQNWTKLTGQVASLPKSSAPVR